MQIKQKLIKKENYWILDINTKILKLLNINPETDKIKYEIKDKTLIITKY